MVLNQHTFMGVKLFDLVQFHSVDTEFARKLSNGTVFSISRTDFLEADAAMATERISSGAMECFAELLRQKLDTYPRELLEDEDEFQNLFWRNWEDLLNEYGVPYYQDDTLDNYAVGDRVFISSQSSPESNEWGTIVAMPVPGNPAEETFDDPEPFMTVKIDGTDNTVQVHVDDIIKLIE